MKSEIGKRNGPLMTAPFYNKIIGEEISKQNQIIKDPVNHADTIIEGEVNFSGTTFEGEVNFSGTTFKGKVDFSGATFEGAFFEGKVDFSGATFEGEVDFSGATFTNATSEGKVDFSGPKFYKKVSFTNARFKQKAIFDSCHFFTSYFTNTHFIKSTSFKNAIFTGETWFYKAIFHDTVDFNLMKVYLSDAPEYQNSNYNGLANFSWTRFKKSVKFSNSEFNGPCFFWRTLFYSDAYFDEIVFKTIVKFYGKKTEIIFSLDDFNNEEAVKYLLDKNILEQDSEIESYYLFHNIDSADELHEKLKESKNDIFSQEDMNKLISIWEDGNLSMFNHKSGEIITFRSTTFEEPDKVEFQALNMARAYLGSKDLAKAHFFDIEWGKKREAKYLPPRNYVIFDELNAKSRDQKIFTSNLYKELENNYKNKGLLNEAGEFGFGKMEMIRQSKSFFARHFSFLAFYKHLCGFGERPLWALFWLFFFAFIIFPFLYMETLNMDSFLKGIIKSLEVSTFLSNKELTVAVVPIRLIQGIERIIVSMQAALTVKSIRNHIKRS